MIEFNKVIITGHLVNDTVQGQDRKGHRFCKGALENRRTWITPDRVQHEEVGQFPFIAWGGVAEQIGRFGAGDQVLLEGKLKLETRPDPARLEVRQEIVIVATAFQHFAPGHAQN